MPTEPEFEIIEPTDDIEVEIVDDLPESDKGRSNLDYDPVTAPKVEDLSTQPAVQARIDELVAGVNTERRLREQAQRDLQASTQAAQALHQQLTLARKTAHTGERAYVEQVKETAELSITTARSQLEKAYESGDPKALAEAQEALADAVWRRNNASTYISTTDYEEVDDVPTTPTPAPRTAPTQPQPNDQQQAIDPVAAAWIERNSWIKTDVAKREKVMEEERRIVSEGVMVGSPMYVRLLDEFVSTKLNVQPRTTQPTAAKVASGRSGAEVKPTTQKRRVQLTQSQLNVAKSLGISPADYARELIATGGI